MVPLIAYTWNMFNIGKVSVVKAHRAMLFYLFIIIMFFIWYIPHMLSQDHFAWVSDQLHWKDPWEFI